MVVVVVLNGSKGSGKRVKRRGRIVDTRRLREKTTIKRLGQAALN
jgi:hypothetical protein